LVKPQPWIPADATDEIRAIAKRDDFGLVLTRHAREQMADRSLIASDILFVLKHGFVLSQAQESTRPDFHKYAIESRSPNSGSRTVRVICIPDPGRLQIKVVTVMWID
jgi:hypothetical protein